MEWNELPENIRADYIRKGVSLGYRSLGDILKNFNTFKKGGVKKGNDNKSLFIKQLNYELSKPENSFFNTPLWKLYFTSLAGRESNYRNVTNKIGASGYFQLMPFNRHSNNLFKDMFDLTKKNYLSLQRNLGRRDYQNMRRLGVDIYGMLGGMHLGGYNAYRALRTMGLSNAKDMNSAGVMDYMKLFSQGKKDMEVLLDDEPAIPVGQLSNTLFTVPKVLITYLNTDDEEPEESEPSIEEYKPELPMNLTSVYYGFNNQPMAYGGNVNKYDLGGYYDDYLARMVQKLKYGDNIMAVPVNNNGDLILLQQRQIEELLQVINNNNNVDNAPEGFYVLDNSEELLPIVLIPDIVNTVPQETVYNVPIGNIHINEDGTITDVSGNTNINSGVITLPEVIVTPKKHSFGGNLYEDGGNKIPLSLLNKYPALNNVQIGIYPNYFYDSKGLGNIEYFSPNTGRIDYGNGVVYNNPNPNNASIMYNPSKYNSTQEAEEAIGLDAVSHGLHLDETYDTLNDMLAATYPDDAISNAMSAYANSKPRVPYKLPETASFDDVSDDPYFINEYYRPAVDGTIRNYIFEQEHPIKNDPAYDVLNYYPYLIEETKEFSPLSVGILQNISNYVRTNERPKNLLPLVVITPSTNSNYNALEGNLFANGGNWKYQNGNWVALKDNVGYYKDNKGNKVYLKKGQKAPIHTIGQDVKGNWNILMSPESGNKGWVTNGGKFLNSDGSASTWNSKKLKFDRTSPNKKNVLLTLYFGENPLTKDEIKFVLQALNSVDSLHKIKVDGLWGKDSIASYRRNIEDSSLGYTLDTPDYNYEIKEFYRDNETGKLKFNHEKLIGVPQNAANILNIRINTLKKPKPSNFKIQSDAIPAYKRTPMYFTDDNGLIWLAANDKFMQDCTINNDGIIFDKDKCTIGFIMNEIPFINNKYIKGKKGGGTTSYYWDWKNLYQNTYAEGGNLFDKGGYTWKPVLLNGNIVYARMGSNGNYIDDLNDQGYTWHTLYSKPDINSTSTRGLTDSEFNDLTLAINSRINDLLLSDLKAQTAFADAYANATTPTAADFYDLGPGLFFTNPFKLSQLVSEGNYKGAALNAGQTLFLSPISTVEHGAMLGYGTYGLANENGIPKTINYFNNGDYGRGLVSAGSDALNGALAFTGLRKLPNTVNTALYNHGYSIGLPTMEGRYFRIVGGADTKAGDAIADANSTGVIRSNAYADFDNAPLDTNTITLRPKSFDYTMWAKDRPWTGSTNGGNAGAKLGLGVGTDSRIISTKADTGSTVWEESNKDFRHKGHTGIFRPRYEGDLQAFPTLYAEWWDRMGDKPWNRFIWRKHQFELPSFTSELDWSPESWFGTRADGIYDNADISALLSHIPEYLNIELKAKADGTWLKMPDGSTWLGDPRSWVLMQSNAYNEYTNNSPFKYKPFAHTSDALFQIFDINKFGYTDDGWYGKGFYSHPAEYLNGKMTAREKYGDNTYLLTTNVLKPLYLNDPNWEWASLFNREHTNVPVGIFDNYDSVYFGLPNTTMNGAFPTELVVPKPSNYKSLLGNNGNFNSSNPNMYRAIIPIGLTGSALLWPLNN